MVAVANNRIELFIGAQISHRSEEVFLRALDQFSASHSSELVVLANFELSGRQFDFVVVGPTSVTVVEAKSSVFPVRGALNGRWEYATADGNWTPATNGYQQVVQLKNFLRDTMGIKSGSFYPDASVVFTTVFAKGSNLTTGNSKADVLQLSGFFSTFPKETGNPWSLMEWRQFAARLHLRRVSLAEAFDHAHATLLATYRECFVREYSSHSDHWIADRGQQQDFIAKAFDFEGSGLFVFGPSGCGKTLMAKAIAVKLARDGVTTLFIQAKTITSSLREAMELEVALLADMPLKSLLQAARKTSSRLCIFLDGLNELSDSHAIQALRGVSILAKRYRAQLVIISQSKQSGLLKGLSHLEVTIPSLDLKLRIAEEASSNLSNSARQMIEAVRSGLEARLVGELQEELGVGITKVNLIDQYVRNRLGVTSRSTYSALRAFALQIFDQASYSASETTFDRLMHMSGLNDQQCAILLSSGLLERRAGRISFIHEMFLFGCAVQAYAQLSASDTTAVSDALNGAFGTALAQDVLAAIDDEKILLELLSCSTSSDVIAQSVMGRSGPSAKSAAEAILTGACSLIVADIQCATLELTVTERPFLQWSHVPNHSIEKVAQFGAMGIAAKHGYLVDEYLDLCRLMDDRLSAECRRLEGEARGYRFALRSESFSLAYLGLYTSKTFSFQKMVQAAQSFLERNVHSDALRKKPLTDLSPGQLYFALEHRHLLYVGHETSFGQQLTELIEASFDQRPYHVQLAILQAAHFLHDAAELVRARLTQALEQLEPNKFNLFVSSSIVDALKSLGALDVEAEESRDGIRAQIYGALEDEDSESSFDQALTVYVAQFDHPFDSIFAEEVAALSEKQKRKLLVRAFCSKHVRQSLAFNWIARELSTADDPADVPLFAAYARSPEVNSFWQDEIRTFVLAVRVLARHGATLPAAPTETQHQQCFACLRAIIVSVEAHRSGSEQPATASWDKLSSLPSPAMMSCLYAIAYEGLGHYSYTSESAAYPSIDLRQIFPTELLTASRAFIRNNAPAIAIQGYKDERATDWALYVIGELGDRSDLSKLRHWMKRPESARSAADAIRSIERRS